MKQIVYEERYERGYLLDESFSFDKPPVFKRHKDLMDRDTMIDSILEFSRFVQLDTDIYETDTELIFRFYFKDRFALNELGLPPFERILPYCDSLSLKKPDNDRIDGILELRYFK
ncbi:MAG: hypothetical protein IJ995_05735 [Clostridia bacterium]|nr:hypothetical protein [Clostridia bacterium]